MDYKQTSLEAYIQVMKDLGKRQRQVLEAIKRLGKCTRLEIANHIRLPINSITPRVKELIELDLVREVGFKPNPHTNTRAAIIEVT